jgi:hypothetical protein
MQVVSCPKQILPLNWYNLPVGWSLLYDSHSSDIHGGLREGKSLTKVKQLGNDGPFDHRANEPTCHS